MRIWDLVPPQQLCRQHLLAQWREGLGLWNVLTRDMQGYRNHPETRRWVEHLPALHALLIETREAMLDRGWTPKDLPQAEPPTHGESTYPEPWDDQLEVLRAKGCDCLVPDAPRRRVTRPPSRTGPSGR